MLSVLFVTVLLSECSKGLIFNTDKFTDITAQCENSKDRPIRYILTEKHPARYISLDPTKPIRNFRKLKEVEQAQEGVKNHVEKKRPETKNSTTLDCVITIETVMPKGDKMGDEFDALSMIVVELKWAKLKEVSNVEVYTRGHEGPRKRRITKSAHYSDRIWTTTNPNFLLSGQLSGFDSIDYRTKLEPEHIIKPETLHSTFDKPASITVNFTKWEWESHIYMVFTSYKYLKHGEPCQEQKEFDCTPRNFLGSQVEHMCMSSTLACDGLPNCGQDFLPNQDENCFKIHWSSVLLSLVSYILLAITLLLCLSCFARVLIQWSVRSSLAELRGGIQSPTGSFRSSSRFFSFLGTTFSSRWERPPPTYDEAMKHVNPDLASRPADPPAYSETYSVSSHPQDLLQQHSGDASSGTPVRIHRQFISCTGGGTSSTSPNSPMQPQVTSSLISTPPPEYDSHPEEDIGGSSQRVHLPLFVRVVPPTPCVPTSINEEIQLPQGPSTNTTVEAEICPIQLGADDVDYLDDTPETARMVE